MIGNFLSYLEATARRVPGRVAFYNDKEQLTFSQLRRAAQAVGSYLGAMMPPRSPAAILMDSRSIWNLPAFLGVVYAGGFYAPMNPSQPAAMLTQLLARLSPAVILTDEKGRKALEDVSVSAPVAAMEDALGTAVDEELLGQIRRGSSSMDPLSLLYTSGSTGIPKGSIHPHLSYLLWTRAVIDRYGLTEDTVFCNQSPFCHANSVLDIFPPLMLGATVYLLPAWALTFPSSP